MAADGHGMQGDLPASDLDRAAGPRGEDVLVAPVTLGRPRWRRRYDRAALALNLAALACSPGFYLLWKHLMQVPLVATILSVVVLSLAGQFALRGWLSQLRRGGSGMSTVLAVGSVETVTALVERTRRAPSLGWRVIGACTPTGAGPEGVSAVDGIPVIGDLDGVAALALANQVDAVSVAPAPGWTAVRLQHLARDLDHSTTALLVDPRLVQRVGPQMRVRGVNGLPLLRLDHPTLGTVARTLKGALDRSGALLAVVVVAPVLLACALAVRRDGGPALRREVRIGKGGSTFSLLTFRITTNDTGPVTRVGRVLRRWCLDELPQLFNVLGGSMALVGPRPPLPFEVAGTAKHEYGRLPVKPGMTGLWQIADEDGPARERAASLTVQYVATWTPLLDVRILLRTIGVVLRAGTAR